MGKPAESHIMCRDMEISFMTRNDYTNAELKWIIHLKQTDNTKQNIRNRSCNKHYMS